MFTVGLHLPLHNARVRSALRGGMVAVATAVSLSLAAGYGAHPASGGPALIYAVVIVSSSAAVALAVIDESRLAGDPDVDRLDHDRRRSAGPGPSVGDLLRGAGLHRGLHRRRRDPRAAPGSCQAAEDYLRLVLSPRHAERAAHELRHARHTRAWKAKDILRAAQLEPLPADTEGVAAKLAKLAAGEPLAPVLLVEREDGPLIVADGYHRVSAAHLRDESTAVPAVEASLHGHP